MHETNHVIDATTSWRAIIMPDGNVEFETDLSFTEWDGDGTAIVDPDTGVDAGHPDYDYLEPWTGEKTIYSAKFSGTTWVETRILIHLLDTGHTSVEQSQEMVTQVLEGEQVSQRVHN